MGALKGMFLFIVVLASFLGLGLYVLFQFLTSFPPGRSRREDELKKLKGEIAPWIPDLISWDEGEIRELSLNQINKKVSGSMKPIGKGVFTSVYHEPMVAYAFRKYKNDSAIVYARTSNHEYAFSMKGKKTQIWIDGQATGTLGADGKFFSADGKKEIAAIKKSPQLLLPVFIEGVEVAGLIHPDRQQEVNPRAFDFAKKMSKENEAIVMALAINNMIKQELRK